jgi:hypothetical protein
VRRLSPGSAVGDSFGQQLMTQVPPEMGNKSLAMDRRMRDDACQVKAEECGMRSIVPPKSNRKERGNMTENCTKGEMLWNETCVI